MHLVDNSSKDNEGKGSNKEEKKVADGPTKEGEDKSTSEYGLHVQ